LVHKVFNIQNVLTLYIKISKKQYGRLAIFLFQARFIKLTKKRKKYCVHRNFNKDGVEKRKEEKGIMSYPLYFFAKNNTVV